MPVTDEYVHADQMAVFADGHVMVLSPVATAALLATGQKWTHLSVIAGAVTDVVGPPPDGSAAEAVAGVLATLQDLDLVELSS